MHAADYSFYPYPRRGHGLLNAAPPVCVALLLHLIFWGGVWFGGVRLTSRDWRERGGKVSAKKKTCVRTNVDTVHDTHTYICHTHVYASHTRARPIYLLALLPRVLVLLAVAAHVLAALGVGAAVVLCCVLLFMAIGIVCVCCGGASFLIDPTD